MKMRELQSGQSLSLDALSTTSVVGGRSLECDEVCAQEERNRSLAAALDISDAVISPLESSAPVYSTFLLEMARWPATHTHCLLSSQAGVIGLP